MKKQKNKFITVLLALVLTMGMTTFAMADTNVTTTGGTGSTQLKYTQGSTFSVTIPAVLTVSPTADTAINITSTNMNIEPSQEVNVAITSGHTAGVVTLSRQNVPAGKTVATIASTIKLNATAIATATKVAHFEDSATPTVNTLAGKLVASAFTGSNEAGDYIGNVTFTITKSAK